MKEENREEKNDSYRPAKRVWQSPEIEEADFESTEVGGLNPSGDLAAFQS